MSDSVFMEIRFTFILLGFPLSLIKQNSTYLYKIYMYTKYKKGSVIVFYLIQFFYDHFYVIDTFEVRYLFRHIFMPLIMMITTVELLQQFLNIMLFNSNSRANISRVPYNTIIGFVLRSLN